MKNIRRNNLGKKCTYSKYFIIYNDKLFSTKNFNIENEMENCFYIRKLGSSTHPKFYLDTKINNVWASKSKLIGGYNELMDFICNNKNNYICSRGFSRASIDQFLKMINSLKNTSIKPVKIKDKKSELMYKRHLLTQRKRLKELKQKINNSEEIENSKQYMTVCNSVFNKNKILSRQKINKIKYEN